MAVNDATVKFEIWDTAGQVPSLAPMYYRGAAAAIGVRHPESEPFARAKSWVRGSSDSPTRRW